MRGHWHRQTRFSDIKRMFEIANATQLHMYVREQVMESEMYDVTVYFDGDFKQENQGVINRKRVFDNREKSSRRFNYRFEYKFVTNAFRQFDGYEQRITDEKLMAEFLILALKVYRQSRNEVYDLRLVKTGDDEFKVEYNVVETKAMLVSESEEYAI